jgi:hypothetical protein
MTRGRRLCGVLAVVVAAGAWPAVVMAGPREPGTPAAQRSRGEGAPAPRADQPLTPADVERMWDTYMAAQARTALNLSDDQFLRFSGRLQDLQGLRRRLQRERNRLRAEMNAMVERNAVVDREAVAARLREFDDLAVRSAQQIRRAYVAIDAVLNLRQRVRFRVFEERMAARKLELLAEARRAARRGGGRPPAPPGAL